MMQEKILQKSRRRKFGQQDRKESILSPVELHTIPANFSHLVDQFLTTRRSARVRAMLKLEQKA